MCPVCWATLLASFSMLIAPLAAAVAAKDWLTLLLAMSLAAAAVLHQIGEVYSPSWLFAGLFCALPVRIIWLVLQRRERLLVILAWGQARTLAKGSCPSVPRKEV